MKKLSLVLILSLSLQAVTIEEAWQELQNSDEGLKASKESIQIVQKKQEAAKSMYLPSVTLSGSYTHLDEPIKIEDDLKLPLLGELPIRVDLSEQDVFLAGLDMLWPLYTGGKIDATQSILKAQVDEQKAKAQIKEDKKFLLLVKYYYGVIVSESLYKTRLKAQEALQIHYNNAKKLYENAQIAHIEVLHAKVNYENAKIETTKARHKLEIAQSALNSLLGQQIDPTSSLHVKSIEKTEDTFKNLMKENSSVLKIFDDKKRQSDELLRIKKAAWHPLVVGYGHYNLYKDDSILSESMPRWIAGVRIQIDILKRRDRSSEIESAKIINAKVKSLKAEALQNLLLLVEKTYKEAQSAYEEYNALGSSIELAQENYRVRKISFNEGLSTSVELVEAQTMLEGIETKRLNAAYEYLQKIAELCVLAGDKEMFFRMIRSNK